MAATSPLDDRIHSRGQWLALAILATLGLVVVPGLNALPADSPLHVPNFLIPLFGKFLCFAIVAVAMDLIWGYTGLLCLCQSLFFALGGYAMGMYLAHHGGPEGIVDAAGWKMPACLYYVYPGGVGETQKDWLVPLFWKPFYWFEFTTILGLLIPGLVAMVIGFFVFRSRVRGVFFAILTQALTLAVWLVFSMNKMKLCGTNGLTRFERVGPFFDPEHSGSMNKLVITGRLTAFCRTSFANRPPQISRRSSKIRSTNRAIELSPDWEIKSLVTRAFKCAISTLVIYNCQLVMFARWQPIRNFASMASVLLS